MKMTEKLQLPTLCQQLWHRYIPLLFPVEYYKPLQWKSPKPNQSKDKTTNPRQARLRSYSRSSFTPQAYSHCRRTVLMYKKQNHLCTDLSCRYCISQLSRWALHELHKNLSITDVTVMGFLFKVIQLCSHGLSLLDTAFADLRDSYFRYLDYILFLRPKIFSFPPMSHCQGLTEIITLMPYLLQLLVKETNFYNSNLHFFCFPALCIWLR